MEVRVIEEDGSSSALDTPLGDVLAFIRWLNQARNSLDGAYALPNFLT